MLFKQLRFAISCLLMQFLKIKNVVAFDFEYRNGFMQVVVITECKSCEISNLIFSNVMFSFSKTKDFLCKKQKIDWLLHKYCKLKR